MIGEFFRPPPLRRILPRTTLLRLSSVIPVAIVDSAIPVALYTCIYRHDRESLLLQQLLIVDLFR
jgi:hypothetical protein